MRILAVLALLTPSAAFLISPGRLPNLRPSLSCQASRLGTVPLLSLPAAPRICLSQSLAGRQGTNQKLLARDGAASGGSDDGYIVTVEDERVAGELQEWLEDVYMEVDYEVRGVFRGSLSTCQQRPAGTLCAPRFSQTDLGLSASVDLQAHRRAWKLVRGRIH